MSAKAATIEAVKNTAVLKPISVRGRIGHRLYRSRDSRARSWSESSCSVQGGRSDVHLVAYSPPANAYRLFQVEEQESYGGVLAAYREAKRARLETSFRWSIDGDARSDRVMPPCEKRVWVKIWPEAMAGWRGWRARRNFEPSVRGSSR